LHKDISMYSTLGPALNYFYGIGKTLSQYAVSKLGIKRNTPLSLISQEELDLLGRIILQSPQQVGELLERELYLRTDALHESRAYRAIRASQGLPSRGQRTHSNAKTAKALKGLWGQTLFAKKMKKSLSRATQKKNTKWDLVASKQNKRKF